MNRNNNIGDSSYNTLKNQHNYNTKSILRNLNNLKSNSKYVKSLNRKKTFTNNNNLSNSNIKIILPNKRNNANSLNNIKPLKIIRQYSFKKKINRNNKKSIFNRIVNNNNSKKDSTILVPDFNSITLRNMKINEKHNINKNNRLMGNKGSMSSLSSNKNINYNNNNCNIKNEKNKKYIFKKNNEFYVEMLRQSNKYDIKNILLENIESINRDSINNINIGYKNHYRKRVFKYFPTKYSESNDNIWRDGENKDYIYKSNYYYNLLMKKIQKQTKINKDKYNNLLEKDINIMHVSKSAEIYL